MDALAAGAAAAVAALFAWALARRYVARGRTNRALVYWSIALVLFTLASLGLVIGDLAGWSSGWFRFYYLFGGVLTVPWLALGTVETASTDRVTVRVLGVAALLIGAVMVAPLLAAEDRSLFATAVVLAVLWGLLLLTAPHDAVGAGSFALVATFSVVAAFAVFAAGLTDRVQIDELPEGSDLFAPGVRSFAVAGNALGATLVIVGAAVSALRLRGRGLPHQLVGNLLIAVGVLIAAFGGFVFAFLGSTGRHALANAIGVSVMYAGFVWATRPVLPDAE